MERDKPLVILALCLIAVLVYGVGMAWRSSAGDVPPVPPTFAAQQADPGVPTPSPTTPTLPTEIPTEAPAPTSGDTAIALQVTPNLTTMPGPVIGETATPGPLPTALPTDTPAAEPTGQPVELPAVVQTDAGLTLREGPGTSYPALAVLLKGAALTVFGRTTDSVWVRVRQAQTQGWVAAEYLRIDGDLNRVRVENPQAVAAIPKAQACVSVVGDSIAYGEVLYEMPGVGFLKVKLAPFAQYVQEALTQRGRVDLVVTDRSYPGIGITSPNHKPYYDLPQFADLLKDRCLFTVVLPWVNDLSSGIPPAQSAPLHAENLLKMARRLIASNPSGRILLVTYYRGAPAAFSLGMAPGYTPEAIDMHNAAMVASCQGGPLSQLVQVTCIDAPTVFRDMGAGYVVGPMRRAEIEAIKVAPITGEELKMLDFYTREDKDRPLTGDGIHLSTVGKTALAAYVASLLVSLPEVKLP